MRGLRSGISLPYFQSRLRATREQGQVAQSAQATATIINGMRPQTIGRVLGIGVRVAGRFLGQQLAGATSSGLPRAQSGQMENSAVQGRAPAQRARQVHAPNRRNISQGVGGFLRPFRRVGGILWLEVTGVFFLLPVVAFAPNIWRYRASYAHGPDHRVFLVSIFVVLVFLYLGVSSFWRARRR
jgi:hypothetical protein